MDLIKKLWLLWASLGAVILGFVTLAAGMLTVGPVLLVLGYCILLPLFLWRSFQDSVGE
jgi:riboflavin transporter FmnP